AQRMDPAPPRRGLRALRSGNRRVRRTLIIGGAAVVGGVVVYALLRLRQASQDAEWQEHLDQARDQLGETREHLATEGTATAAKPAHSAQAAQGKAKESVRSTAGADRSKADGRPGN